MAVVNPQIRAGPEIELGVDGLEAMLAVLAALVVQTETAFTEIVPELKVVGTVTIIELVFWLPLKTKPAGRVHS